MTPADAWRILAVQTERRSAQAERSIIQGECLFSVDDHLAALTALATIADALNLPIQGSATKGLLQSMYDRDAKQMIFREVLHAPVQPLGQDERNGSK